MIWGKENQSELQTRSGSKRALEHVSWDASTHDLLGVTALNTLSTPPTLNKLQN